MVQCRAKVRSLHLRRSYFAPSKSRSVGQSGFWWRRRVPPPGPNGLFHRLFIAIVGQADETNIGSDEGKIKAKPPLIRLCQTVQPRVDLRGYSIKSRSR
ncbi:hypothetical protein MPL3365_30631 [Mesorhizobium plurifarium]|uniref:Uncharacterized protein n=1 Tax=Mesorhizobium plurifarium TaxID=69974 RepID=A0A090G8R5_MESPL|nr:hypothetical protein MPL3365_30631 [Mesorhizobium plurifarium]